MRHTATSYGVSLNLAHDRAHRDQQAADAWRRLHAQPDATRDAAVGSSPRSIRPIVTSLVGALRMRMTRSTI